MRRVSDGVETHYAALQEILRSQIDAALSDPGAGRRASDIFARLRAFHAELVNAEGGAKAAENDRDGPASAR